MRTYTALLTALGNAQQWWRAVELLFVMQTPERGGVLPNAYTYSALLKALGEHGQWQLAEAVFAHLEAQVSYRKVASHGPQTYLQSTLGPSAFADLCVTLHKVSAVWAGAAPFVLASLVVGLSLMKNGS